MAQEQFGDFASFPVELHEDRQRVEERHNMWRNFLDLDKPALDALIEQDKEWRSKPRPGKYMVEGIDYNDPAPIIPHAPGGPIGIEWCYLLVQFFSFPNKHDTLCLALNDTHAERDTESWKLVL